MDTRDSLLAAIAAAPHDDIPRLVYADFLDEQDNKRDQACAAFIRLGCSLDIAKARQTPAEGRFLHEHWRLLLPGVSAQFSLRRRNGRRLVLQRTEKIIAANFVTGLPYIADYNHWLIVTFWRGFVSHAFTYRSFEIPDLKAALEGQPFALATCQDAIGTWSNGADIMRFFSGSRYWLLVWDAIQGATEIINVAGQHNRPIAKRFRGEDAHEKAKQALSAALHATPLPTTVGNSSTDDDT